MTASVDASFQSAIDALALPGVTIGHRLISPGDEDALLPEEAAAFAASVVKVRRASGAARIVARQLLTRLGHPECALPKAASGAPDLAAPASSARWPTIPALRSRRCARAATSARSESTSSRRKLLPPELLDLVATPRERLKLADDPYHGRLLFVAKEAVYKAVYPLDQTFLEHHDVEINLADRKAIVRNSRVVESDFASPSTWWYSRFSRRKIRHDECRRLAIPGTTRGISAASILGFFAGRAGGPAP